MDASLDIAQLQPGDVVHHPTHGFACVEEIGEFGRGVMLRWETPTEYLPRRVSPTNLAQSYAWCTPGGLLERSVEDADALHRLIRDAPVVGMMLVLDHAGDALGREEIEAALDSRKVGLPDGDRDAWWAEARRRTAADDRFTWDGDRVSLAPAPALPAPDDSPVAWAEALLRCPPKTRLALAADAPDAAKSATLEAAAQRRDHAGVRLLLRLGGEVPDEATFAVMDMAAGGDPYIAAALMRRNLGPAEGAFASMAAAPERRPQLQRALQLLQRAERTDAVLSMLERALASGGDDDTIHFLSDALPGGIASYLGPLGSDPLTQEGATRWPLAMKWLQSQSSQATVDRPSQVAGVLLTDIRPLSASQLFPLSIELARALARRQTAGACGGVLGARKLSNGGVELGPPEDTSPAEDVGNAMRLLLRQAIGSLPRRREVSDEALLAHFAALVPDAPSDWVAVATRAVSPVLAHRPTNAVDLWEQLEQAAATDRVRRECPPFARAPLDIGYDTHIGLMKSRVGQTNQDALYFNNEDGLTLMVVADGISVATAGSGNLASALLVQVLANLWEQRSPELTGADNDALHQFIDDALAAANTTICEASLRLAGGDLGRHIPMGTTAMLAIARGSTVCLGSLGDSRTFLVGATGASLLTPDHNLRGEWLLAWQRGQTMELLNEGFALTGYCGHFDETGAPMPVPPTHRTVNLLPGEALVLATDGLTDYAAESMSQMAIYLEEAGRETDLGAATRNLVNLANSGGGGDNVTVLIARMRPG